MSQSISLIEFLCLTCGFQGLSEKSSESEECPKCQGKILSSEQRDEFRKMLL